MNRRHFFGIAALGALSIPGVNLIRGTEDRYINAAAAAGTETVQAEPDTTINVVVPFSENTDVVEQWPVTAAQKQYIEETAVYANAIMPSVKLEHAAIEPQEGVIYYNYEDLERVTGEDFNGAVYAALRLNAKLNGDDPNYVTPKDYTTDINSVNAAVNAVQQMFAMTYPEIKDFMEPADAEKAKAEIDAALEKVELVGALMEEITAQRITNVELRIRRGTLPNVERVDAPAAPAPR